MQLKLILSIALLAVAPALSALSADQVVQTLNSLTTIVKNLKGPASSLSATNIGAITAVSHGNNNLTDNMTAMIHAQAQNAVGPYSAEDQKKICAAYQSFAQADEDYLNILIGKAPLVTQIPGLGIPLASSLRALEGVTDSYDRDIIDLVPTCAADIQATANNMEMALSNATSAYS